jgi:GNAT superfamily N-acetyltransferase
MENLVFKKLKKRMIKECVDLYIDTFSREPWKEVFDSKKKVYDLFLKHYKNNYFVGYVVMSDKKITALSIGMKKPWVQGLEYYIDEFCVRYDMQGKGVGSWFIKAIEENVHKQGMNTIILNTERGFPSHKFYLKNGFRVINNLIVLIKSFH